MEAKPVSSLRRSATMLLALTLMLGLSVVASVVSGVGMATAQAAEPEAVPVEPAIMDEDDPYDPTIDSDNPEIDAIAFDPDTRDAIARANEQVIITDEVLYEYLQPETQYTLTATLVKRSNGEEVATESETFVTDETGSGRKTIDFVFDGTELAGDSLVIFEYLLLDGVEVTSHANMDDEWQVIRLPKVEKEAMDKADGDHTVNPDSEVTVVDRVSYANLLPAPTDFEYTVTGTVVRKSDGQPLVVDGSVVGVTQSFTPETSDGTVNLEFTFDASGLEGEELVLFERIFYGDVVVAVHEDLEDAAQTIVVDKRADAGSADPGKTGSDLELASDVPPPAPAESKPSASSAATPSARAASPRPSSPLAVQLNVPADVSARPDVLVPQVPLAVGTPIASGSDMGWGVGPSGLISTTSVLSRTGVAAGSAVLAMIALLAAGLLVRRCIR